MSILAQVRQAITHLNPSEVREQAERPFLIGIYAMNESFIRDLEHFLLPSTLTVERRREASQLCKRAAQHSGPFDLEIFEPGMPKTAKGIVFEPAKPAQFVDEVLKRHEDLGLPLARAFPAFRAAVTKRAIHMVSRENALFSVATALPNVAPLLGLGWAVGEFASDTAVLTANQVRLTFLLAAASDRAVGYGEQKAEIASIIAGAFGWRAIARELVGKIPLGGGLIPKAAIAYAGTYVMGQSFERFYRMGYGYSRQERKSAFGEAFERGKAIVSAVVERLQEKKPENKKASA
jgi:hypothetical protein